MHSVSMITPKLITPPKLHSNTVIKAIKSHKAKTSREFSFEVDDCFYLVGGASEAREYLEVIHPRSRQPGLVPAQKFEFVRATALNNIPKSQHTTKNVLAYVTQNYYRITSYDLEANKGDPVLILEDLCESFYLAKLIGKVDSPGRIPKTHVELKDEISQRTASCVNPSQLLVNQSRALRKNNSLGNVVRTEKNKAFVSRRTESIPNSQSSSLINPFSSWGILNAELNLGSLNISENTPSEASVILDTVPISHINVIRGLEHQGYSLVELEVHLCDSSRRTIFRPSSCFKKLQLSLLESFPKESGLTGQSRIMPYMPTLNQTSSEPQLSENEVKDFNDFFQELLEVNALLPRCRPLLNFISPQPQDKELAHRATCLNRNTGKGHFKTSSGQISKLTLQVNKLFRNPEVAPSKPTPDSLFSLSNRDSFSTISSQSTVPSSRTSSHFSTKDLPSPPPLTTLNHPVKVKLQYHSDMMAFILPAASFDFSSLVAKITSRIGHPPNSIAHYDPASPNQRRRFIAGPQDLDLILQRSPNKLWLIVD